MKIKYSKFYLLMFSLVIIYQEQSEAACPEYITKDFVSISVEAFQQFRKVPNETYELEAVFRERAYDAANHIGERVLNYRLVFKIMGSNKRLRLATYLHSNDTLPFQHYVEIALPVKSYKPWWSDKQIGYRWGEPGRVSIGLKSKSDLPKLEALAEKISGEEAEIKHIYKEFYAWRLSAAQANQLLEQDYVDRLKEEGSEFITYANIGNANGSAVLPEDFTFEDILDCTHKGGNHE